MKAASLRRERARAADDRGAWPDSRRGPRPADSEPDRCRAHYSWSVGSPHTLPTSRQLAPGLSNNMALFFTDYSLLQTILWVLSGSTMRAGSTSLRQTPGGQSFLTPAAIPLRPPTSPQKNRPAQKPIAMDCNIGLALRNCGA